jgi:hypothetical protein
LLRTAVVAVGELLRFTLRFLTRAYVRTTAIEWDS